MKIIIIYIALVLFTFISVFPQNELNKTQDFIGAKERLEIIDTIIKKLNDFYVFPEIAKKYEKHLRNQLKNNAYDSIFNLSDFTSKLTQDLLFIYPDRHLEILEYNEKRDFVQTEETFEDWWKSYVKGAKFRNYGFNELEILPGNIGFLDLKFMERFELCEKTADAAMEFLSNSNAIIIDIRNNPGGRLLIVQYLMSYFMEGGIHYSTEIARLKGTTSEWRTLEEIQGKRMLNTPLYLLTSYGTGSGAETFAYTLKHFERAILVGDTTAGAAHKTHDHAFPKLGIMLAIPDGNSVNQITGTDWEGVGVIPHIAVSSKNALDVAYEMALDSVMKTEEDNDIYFKLDWVKKAIAIKNKPLVLDENMMEQYVGKYGARRINLKEGKLYYHRIDRPEYELIPLENDLFILDGLNYFRITFKRDEVGDIIQLVGLYDDGTTSISIRE